MKNLLRAVVFLALAAAVPAARAEDLTAKDAARARKLYNLKCAKCHKFYDPTNYNQAEWDGWMEKMARKSKLSAPQQELLTRYFETFRRGRGAGN